VKFILDDFGAEESEVDLVNFSDIDISPESAEGKKQIAKREALLARVAANAAQTPTVTVTAKPNAAIVVGAIVDGLHCAYLHWYGKNKVRVKHSQCDIDHKELSGVLEQLGWMQSGDQNFGAHDPNRSMWTFHKSKERQRIEVAAQTPSVVMEPTEPTAPKHRYRLVEVLAKNGKTLNLTTEIETGKRISGHRVPYDGRPINQPSEFTNMEGILNLLMERNCFIPGNARAVAAGYIAETPTVHDDTVKTIDEILATI
jgi:hypothetical protein